MYKVPINMHVRTLIIRIPLEGSIRGFYTGSIRVVGLLLIRVCRTVLGT